MADPEITHHLFKPEVYVTFRDDVPVSVSIDWFDSFSGSYTEEYNDVTDHPQGNAACEYVDNLVYGGQLQSGNILAIDRKQVRQAISVLTSLLDDPTPDT